MTEASPGIDVATGPPPWVRKSRRHWLRDTATLGLAGAAAGCGVARFRPAAPARDCFQLGVASGCLGSDRLLLWTRLIGLPAVEQSVDWVLAADEALTRVVARGRVAARPDHAHSVRVEVDGLEPDRWYWYRFAVPGAQSRIGRSRTLPAADQPLQRLRLAVASCQHYEHGYYAAWRHVVSDAPDLILHLGDYLYEGSWGRQPVRPLDLPEARTLEQYRERYRIYRSDPDLQAAHAAAPWLVVWDDHEVSNDYAGLVPERLEDAASFPARRAAAYQAWYEHMPVPASILLPGGGLRLYRSVVAGDLMTLHLLDSRQHRSQQVCPRPGRAGGGVVDPAACQELHDPARTLLGAEQEAWLADGFGRSRSRWNLIGQQTLVAPLNLSEPGSGQQRFRTDGWDGYPAARRRLIEAMQSRRLVNPVLLGGDLHAFHVARLRAGERDDDPVVAAEFVGTSISSQAPVARFYQRLRAANPDLLWADGSQRGYLRLDLQPSRIEVALMGLADVRRADSSIATQARWVVEAGRPGVERG